MKKTPGQSGFSLIEVMFGVVILTMGLIFVASQFPLGLDASRTVAYKTLVPIEAENSRIMTKLQLPGNIGNGLFIDNVDTRVRFLYQPNVRPAFSQPSRPNVVMDDPFNSFYLTAPPANKTYQEGTGIGEVPPYITRTEYGTLDRIAPLNIGQIVLPAVDMTDPDVLALIYEIDSDYLPADDDGELLNEKVYEVAQKRSLSSLRFYKCLGANTTEFCLYTFILNTTNKNLRYAVQDEGQLANPTPLNANQQDRLFPIPWLVELARPINPNDPSDFDSSIVYEFALNEFTQFPDAIANIIRRGTVLLDADFGHLYKIDQIESDGEGTYFIRLDRPLNEMNGEFLENFWIVPPAYDGVIFLDQQPVIDVVRQIVKL